MRKLDALKLVQSHQEELQKLGVKSFNLFGSVARDQANSQSDIGEAAINIPADVQALAPELPWRLMSDMRNIMAHEYFQVNLRITWSTIQIALFFAPEVVQINHKTTDTGQPRHPPPLPN